MAKPILVVFQMLPHRPRIRVHLHAVFKMRVKPNRLNLLSCIRALTLGLLETPIWVVIFLRSFNSLIFSGILLHYLLSCYTRQLIGLGMFDIPLPKGEGGRGAQG